MEFNNPFFPEVKTVTFMAVLFATFLFAGLISGYSMGRKAGRIETYQQAVKHGFADRCADGSFEWRKAGG
jgi:hypothetical protein